MLLRDPGSPIFRRVCSHDPESIHALNDETEHEEVEKSTPQDINHFQLFRLNRLTFVWILERCPRGDEAPNQLS